MDNQISKTGLYVVMFGMMISGTCCVLVLKSQDTTLTDNCNYFTHPYFQGMVMFVGELCSFVYYFIHLKMNKNE